MDHPCINGNCVWWDDSYEGPKQVNGKDCYGYMDYKDDTQGWSECSVKDFTDYINRQESFCLPPLNGGGENLLAIKIYKSVVVIGVYSNTPLEILKKIIRIKI